MPSNEANTGPQGGAPALPNNFTGQKPADCSAPKIGSQGMKPSPNASERGKDGTAQ